jgi:PAS domain S-box-containing protein
MEFWRFVDPSRDRGSEMVGTHDPVLVVLSIAVACLAGFAALSVVDRIRSAKTVGGKRGWLAAGGVAMGCGIWAMHFTAMTAFSMDMPASYGWSLTLLSMVPGIAGSTVALQFMSRTSITWWSLQLAGLLMASGIGAMHYIGMEAMVMPAILAYDPVLFVLSIVVAHVLATIALYIKTILSTRAWFDTRLAKITSAVVLGHAVAGMHYTAMAAARFFHDPTVVVTGGGFSPLTLGASICGVTSIIMGLTIIGTITDRHFEEAAARLHESEAWADAILKTAADGIISIDQNGVIRSFNKMAESMFGYEGREAIGSNVKILMPAPFSEAHDGYLARYVREGASQIIGTYREVVGRRKDGTTFPMELGVSELIHDDGFVFIGSVRDITLRKSLEGQLAHAQKLESIGHLAAGIAHEINTPIQFIGDNTRFLETAFSDLKAVLAACSELTEVASDGLASTNLATKVRMAAQQADLEYLQEEVPKAIGQSLEGIERVSRIVMAMKEFSHPGTKEKQPSDLNRAIDSTVTVSRNEWKYIADLETDLDPDLPPVPCIVGELNQVILNIIINAAHAIAAAKEVDPEAKGLIRITTRRDGSWVEIRISDTGTGIPQEIRSKIFDPFFTTKEVGKGTGQGLAIAYATIKDKHGGTLAVESEVGKGTAFLVRLPLAIESSDADTAPSSA